jgi:hypothetical protein
MALAFMSGWPEEPDSPLHSFGGVAAGAGAWAVKTAGLAAPETGIGGIKRSGCARPGATAPSMSAALSIKREAKSLSISLFPDRWGNP